MTSDGSAVTRLQRALANPRASAAQIRAIAAELPTVGLEDALAILLALIDREPQTFPRAAARWGARFTVERRVSLVDAQLALAALAVLPGPGARAGAEALIELSDRSLGTSFVSDLSAGRGPTLPAINRATTTPAPHQTALNRDCALSDTSWGMLRPGEK